MKVLNCYAGLGGNRKNWKGVEVVAVEQNEKIAAIYQEQHPNDLVIVGDAHKYILDHFEEFDFIWSSPPCQSHSSMAISGQNKTPRYPDLKLYEEIIFLKQHSKGLFVVENVKPYYQPLIPAQHIGRHLFWTNFQLQPMEDEPKLQGFIKQGTEIGKAALMDWLGIHYEGNIYYDNNHDQCQVLRNCVHPLLGEHVFKCALGYQVNENSKQKVMEL